MNGIAEEVRREVLAAYVGTEDDVLLETPLSGTLFTGYTRLYIPVVVSAPGHESGQTASASVQHFAEFTRLKLLILYTRTYTTNF